MTASKFLETFNKMQPTVTKDGMPAWEHNYQQMRDALYPRRVLPMSFAKSVSFSGKGKFIWNTLSLAFVPFESEHISSFMKISYENTNNPPRFGSHIIAPKGFNGKTNRYVAFSYFAVEVPVDDMVMTHAEFRKKYKDERLHHCHRSFLKNESLFVIRKRGRRKEIEIMTRTTPPVRHGIPTKLTQTLLDGLHVPVRKGSSKSVMKAEAVGMFAHGFYPLKNSTKMQRSQGKYTSYEGALFLVNLAKKSKEFRRYLDAYGPFLDEERIKAHMVLNELNRTYRAKDHLPYWIKDTPVGEVGEDSNEIPG